MTLTLPPDTVGLFGYGSLLLRSSMERTLGRPYGAGPTVCTLRGWRRTWDSIYPNDRYYFQTSSSGKCYPAHIIYLNIRRDAGMLNGLIYLVGHDDLAGFDRRESVYDRIQINADLVEEVSGGPVYAYVGKRGCLLEKPVPIEQAAIRASYLAIVENGLEELGPDFRRVYERSTDTPPADCIVDDRLD